MKNIFKPGSRLIILFILTLIISGGILTWLSINSISNFKELTEKKVREEQLTIVEQLSSDFQQNLEDITGKFTAIVIKDNEIDLAGLKYCDTLKFVENPFILNNKGEFIWPWFLEDPKAGTEKVSSSAYMQDIQIAEKNEFREQNYNTAAHYYKASMEHASGEPDSVKSINALARVHLKMQNIDRAYFYYAYINSNYYSVLDNNGFPYVYYAVLNIMKLSDSENSSRIFIELELFLSGLTSGKIPLNNSTSEILAQIISWIDKNKMAGDNQIPELYDYIQNTERNLRFINKYNKIIKTSLESGESPENQHMLGRFNVINETRTDPGKIIVIHSDLEYALGFCIELDQIWSKTIAANFDKNTEFEYDIDLIGREESVFQNANELSISTEFSTLFPAYMIRVGLKDKNLVDIYVKRRSWTYGIALILLLGAMLLGILLILRDILREKRLSHLRSDFVSNVTHELKTPLTSIHLFAESVLLDRVNTASERKEYHQIILNETERLIRIINNILDFSKKEKGKIEYKTERVNVTDLIKSALNDLNYWLVEKNFSIQTELEENIIITADYDAFKQVVINLLDNAIKYSGNNKKIHVRLVSDKDLIRIEFEDNGIGIPSNKLEAIFEKFYRVNESLNDGIGGTGLGLTVVKEIIDAHNGEIIVESIVNKGSKFTIVLDSP